MFSLRSTEIYLSAFSIAVVVLRAQTNRIADLRLLIPKLLTAIPTSKTGEVTWVESASQ